MAAGPDRGAVTPMTISVSVTPGVRGCAPTVGGRAAIARARIATRTSAGISAEGFGVVGRGAELHRRISSIDSQDDTATVRKSHASLGIALGKVNARARPTTRVPLADGA